MSSPEPYTSRELIDRLEILERWAKEHSGPERGRTSLNFPHSDMLLLDDSGKVPADALPPNPALSLYYL